MSVHDQAALPKTMEGTAGIKQAGKEEVLLLGPVALIYALGLFIAWKALAREEEETPRKR